MYLFIHINNDLKALKIKLKKKTSRSLKKKNGMYLLCRKIGHQQEKINENESLSSVCKYFRMK